MTRRQKSLKYYIDTCTVVISVIVNSEIILRSELLQIMGLGEYFNNKITF